MTTVYVERYCFTMTHKFVAGKPESVLLKYNPTMAFNPQVVTTNVTEPGLMMGSELTVDDNLVVVHVGEIDLYTYNPNTMGREIDMPPVQPSSFITLRVRYTGKRPAWYKKWWQFWKRSTPVHFAVSFKGQVV